MIFLFVLGTYPSHTHMCELPLADSDQSVLERHHLASAFAVMKTKGYDILSGLSSEDYRIVRSLIIEVVLATDLMQHFDFIGRLKALAAKSGHAAFSAASSAMSRGVGGSHGGGGAKLAPISRCGCRRLQYAVERRRN